MAPTLGPLWSRYLEVWEKLRAGEGLPDEAARREAEREAGQLRDRLLVNYSLLVKYVAGRVGARMQGAIEQEDMISYFYEGRTLKEIGKALGLTEGRISQILRDALSKLREHLKRSSLAHENWQALG